MIVVVDYHKGNLKSVERGLAHVGAEVRVTDDAAVIARASAVVLPGVGSFADAAASMERLGQREAVSNRVSAGVPFLGICLGMQLLFEYGEEGAADEPVAGLGILPGTVRALPARDARGVAYKVPHVGWNSLEPVAAAAETGGKVAGDPVSACGSGSEGVYGAVAAGRAGEGFACDLLAGIPAGEYFYFTHSYVVPAGAATVATTVHSIAFPSVVQAGPVAFGVQFHPEKSSDAGMALLRNFVRLAERA